MLFSGGACSRRVSLFLKPFSFPRRCAKLEREREGVGSWERAGEFCRRRCFVLCGMPREGGKRQKKNLFDLKVARQTKKQEVIKKHTKKRRKREGPESQYAFNLTGVHKCSHIVTYYLTF